jgi:copper homeostasis protein (lipoprotein)
LARARATCLGALMFAVTAAPSAPAATPAPAVATAMVGSVAPGASAPSGAPLPPGGPALGPLPANFGGVLPCADCQGIRQSLDLFPDGAFHWRSTYLGKPAGEVPDDVGRWRFASDDRTLLLFGGREAPVRFVLRDDGALRLLDLDGRPIQSSFNYELRRAPGAFTPFEPRATLRGAYVYFADAPTFTDCATGVRLAVAQEADSLALERAYVAAKQPPATPRLVLVEGRIVQRPPMEGPGPRATLVVEKFLRLGNPAEACPAPPANAPLAGTRWRLTRLEDEPVIGGARKREAWLQFDATQTRIAGSGGCNAISGSYAVDGAALRFSKVAATMTGCRDDAQQDRAFVAVLGRVQRWLVAGSLLEFIDADERLLARFEAAPATLTVR